MLDTNLKNNDDLEMKNAGNENVTNGNVVKKNHNWKILGIIAMILTVFIAAGATVGLYPYMEEKAAEFNSRNRRQETEAAGGFGNLTTQVMNFSYVLWHQQKQEENGGILTYSQTFLAGDGIGAVDVLHGEDAQNVPETEKKTDPVSGADAVVSADVAENVVATESADQTSGQTVAQTEALAEAADPAITEQQQAAGNEDAEDITAFREEIKDLIDELGTSWNNLYNQYNERISYAVMDPQGGYLRSNVSAPEEIFSRTVADNVLQFTVHFDENGRLTVSGVTGLESNCSGLIRSIGRFEFYDPLAARLNNSYRRSGLEFSGPKNMTIKFRCQPTQLGSWNEEKPRNAYAYDNYDYQSGHGFITVVAYVSMAVLVAALLIPFIPGMEVVKMKIFSWSLEPLCVIGVGWLLLFLNMEIPLDIVRSFMAGTLQAELAKAGFLPFMANALAVAANFLFWVVIYGMFYWGVTSFRSFFSLGPWCYFKERTWLGKFLRFCKHWVCTGLDLFSQTDWESRSSKIIGKAVLANFVILACISLLWFWGIGALVLYSLVLFFLLKKYWGKVQEKYHKLLNCIQEMAEGNLDVKEEEDLGIFEPFKNQLFKVQEGFKKAVEKEVKSERTKTELITNVSHDIKTPLTSIINYVDLLKRQKIQDPKIASYLEVLDQKSQRLKTLTEDLVEASKASSGNLKLEMADIDLVELVQQTNGEFEERFEQRHLKIISDFPDGMIIIRADGRRLWRVLENLYTNAFKYAQEGSRVYVDVASVDGKAIFTMKNISEKPLNISPDELTERFVRGDVARTTEGSGLGLSIARSLTQLQKGEFVITIDGDLFKAQVIFPQVRQETRAEMRLERAAEEKQAEEQSGEKMSGEMPVGENLLESAPYNWDVMVENDKNLTAKEEILIQNGKREHKPET